jgi:hypothetical protein
VRTYNGETMLTLKEASEKYFVPVSWIRKQIGKSILPEGKAVRIVKFPADKNYYVFESEMEEISKPRVYSTEFMEDTRKRYEVNPEDTFEDEA